ncbi:MAG: SDR family NAD(P)-dependent oxidoreductase, partial [Nitrospinaceae bacterium]|nr:SDR family NAD(P)-dependent oxidoreductase [Nitrospinaceae bacterium]
MKELKRAVVTGGAGFIGSHLVDRLLADGHEVVAIDSLVAGRRENLKTAEGHPNFTFHQADVASLEKIQPYFDGVDWVFHLASLADIVPSIQQP